MRSHMKARPVSVMGLILTSLLNQLSKAPHRAHVGARVPTSGFVQKVWRALFCASEAKAHTVKTNKKALKSAIVKPRWAPKHILSLLLPAGEMKAMGAG